jgi:CarboxypepD_reg-like domain
MLVRLARLIGALAIAGVGAGPGTLLAQAPPPRYGKVVGVVIDSLHNMPLVHADVQIEGTARIAHTDSAGDFRFDSVPAGAIQLAVFHPLLDSLGLAVASPPLTVRGGDTLLVTLATPSGTVLAASACMDVPRPGGVLTPDAVGPAEILGRVLDADTDRPISDVEVSVNWVEIRVGKQVGFQRDRHTRAATTGAGGDFRLCYLPSDLDGSLHAVRRNGGPVASSPYSEVQRSVQVHGHLITLITLHMASPPAPTIASLAAEATVPTDTQPHAANGPASAPAAAKPRGPLHPYVVGAAVLTGHVMTPKTTQPVAGADVFVVGGGDSAVTSRTGDFTLQHLPSGTRMLVIRAIGFEPYTMTVELSARAPQHVNVAFSVRTIPVMTPVVVTARYDSGLKRVGFDARRATGMGTFWTQDQIDSHKANEFHDLFGTFSGVLIDYDEQGRASLMASRAAGACIGYTNNSTTGQLQATPGENCGPCLTYVIDGMPYDELEEGDMDTYIRPTEIGAIEIYLPSQVPHSIPGVIKPDCLNIVIWSKAKLGI